MIGRTLVAKHAIKAVELALELAGGAGFYRANGLERRFRDIQGARYHPLQQGPQADYAGLDGARPARRQGVLGRVEIQVRTSRKWWISRTGAERTFRYVSTGSAESRHLQAGMA